MANKISLDAHKHLQESEIISHLKNVEYIIMAAPNPDERSKSPIHFTIFLNTSDALPQDIQAAVLDKFCHQYHITKVDHLLSELAKVGFAETREETLMPMHLFKPEDQQNIPGVIMHIMDFLGDSTGFDEVKKEDQTGWSYSYNED
jgi:hypothetical protein